ncbi:MAG: hypothetical protein LBS71_00225 [Puniceicoccales bacterium]|jgi:hypothetical protein|nr:hypothetical protein [Puniceicoccales bacterium]
MKKKFINYQLIISLGMCTVFVAFATIFGVLYFRQEAFVHAGNLKKLEIQYNILQNKTLALLAKTAQMQTTNYLRQKLLAFLDVPERIFYVRQWSDYKGSHMTRNALAMNINQQFFQ